jgi:hypothetical protein
MLELSGRPLLDNPRDAMLFTGRERLIRQSVRAARQGVNALLVGTRGSGKTSTLHRLAARLREEGRTVVLLVGRAAPEAADLLQVLRWKLGGSLAGMPDAAGGETERLLMLIQAIGEVTRDDRSATVLLDEAGSANVAHQVFGRLRDELWRLPLTWLVTADAADRGGYLKPPADAFFSQVLTLEPLDGDTSRDLLGARAPVLGPEAIALLAEAAGGNPRALLQMARDVLLGDRSAGEVAGLVTRKAEAAGLLGEAAQRLYRELAAGGGLSVSDPSLLRRLGWSRPRAQQVISKLECAGLVESAIEPASRGRPRKLYRLTGQVGA